MRPLVVLHVEDNPDDLYLLAKAGRTAGLCADFRSVSGGAEAVAYLRGDDRFSDREQFPLPDVIVLDLIMPEMDGFEFLRWLRQDAPCGPVPVLVFTGSLKDADRVRALELGVKGYFLKPAHFDALVKLVGSCLGSQPEGIG